MKFPEGCSTTIVLLLGTTTSLEVGPPPKGRGL